VTVRRPAIQSLAAALRCVMQAWCAAPTRALTMWQLGLQLHAAACLIPCSLGRVLVASKNLSRPAKQVIRCYVKHLPGVGQVTNVRPLGSYSTLSATARACEQTLGRGMVGAMQGAGYVSAFGVCQPHPMYQAAASLRQEGRQVANEGLSSPRPACLQAPVGGVCAKSLQMATPEGCRSRAAHDKTHSHPRVSAVRAGSL
jgi:hypothetical protein